MNHDVINILREMIKALDAKAVDRTTIRNSVVEAVWEIYDDVDAPKIITEAFAEVDTAS